MKKRFVAVLLTLVFCLTAVFPVAAAQPSAKGIILAAAKNMDLGVSKEFYEKSEGKTELKVTKFDGSLKEKTGDYLGATLGLTVAYDVSKSAMKLGYDVNSKDIKRDGDIYLHGDKLVLTKDLLFLLQDFGLNVFEEAGIAPADIPEYLYTVDAQLAPMWEQMESYKNQQLPEEYTELLLFFVEAIPDECFGLTPSKVTMKLDRGDLENTIVNLLNKVKNESERAVDMIINLNGPNFEQMGIDPGEIRQEMISVLQDFTVPSKSEIQLVTSFVDVNDFSFEYSLLPSGPKNFNLDLGFKEPINLVGGSFNFALETAGQQDNLKMAYQFGGQYNDPQGLSVAFSSDSSAGYAHTAGQSVTDFDLTIQDNKTGELILDLGLEGHGVSKIAPDLLLKVPALTPENSMDLTGLLTLFGASPGLVTTETTVTNELVMSDVSLVVNGSSLDAKPFTATNGEMMVPARVVLEELGYEVAWVEPNKMHINKMVSVTVDKNSTVPPALVAGQAMISVNYLASELGVEVELEGDVLALSK